MQQHATSTRRPMDLTGLGEEQKRGTKELRPCSLCRLPVGLDIRVCPFPDTSCFTSERRQQELQLRRIDNRSPAVPSLSHFKGSTSTSTSAAARALRKSFQTHLPAASSCLPIHPSLSSCSFHHLIGVLEARGLVSAALLFFFLLWDLAPLGRALQALFPFHILTFPYFSSYIHPSLCIRVSSLGVSDTTHHPYT